MNRRKRERDEKSVTTITLRHKGAALRALATVVVLALLSALALPVVGTSSALDLERITRTYIAPMSSHDGHVLWEQASQIEPNALNIAAVPEPHRKLEVTITPEALVQNASQSEEGFLTMLEESERMQILHNPSFGFYSDANETRSAFIERCMEEANRRLED